MANVTGKGGLGERPQHINRKGRPKTFDALRAEAIKIAGEVLTSPDGAQSISRINVILMDWALSKDVRKQQLLVEYAFGKVPNREEISGPDGKAIEIKTTDYRIAIAPLAPRPVGDSNAPGEDESRLHGETVGENDDERRNRTGGSSNG